MPETLLVVTNAPNAPTAEAIACALLERQLAACVNILPGVQSLYRWQGAIERAEELTLLIKTARTRYADVEAEIRANHPYDVPEIIAFPVGAGLPAYLAWIHAETRSSLDA